MRVGDSRRVRTRWPVVAAASLVVALAGTSARAQLPQPREPDIKKRSGLLTRFIPIEPHLPPDPYRDTFWDTRFGDQPTPPLPNCIKGGGLYGFFWRAKCTASIYPYFYGSPGENSLGPECRRCWKPLRYAQGLVHPFRPVGMYYDQGSYVPIHDLDPFVPGPGPYPFPWYLGGPHGG
jgi:hypothetical protein